MRKTETLVSREILMLREVIDKLVPLLAGQKVKVTQRGTTARVICDPKTLKPIIVNIPYLPDNAPQELVLAVQGFIDHEIGHVLFSDWMIPVSIADKPKLHSLCNMTEDVFVERKIGEKFPGAVHNIGLLHEFFLDKITKPALAKVKGDEKEQFAILMVPLIRAWAGQKVFKDFIELHKEQPLLKKFMEAMPKDAIKRIPKLKDSGEALEIALIMHDILTPPPKEEEPPPPPEDEEEKKSEPTGGKGEEPEDEGEGSSESGEPDETGAEDESEGGPSDGESSEEEKDEEGDADGDHSEPEETEDRGESDDADDPDASETDGDNASDAGDEEDDGADPEEDEGSDDPELDAGLDDERSDDEADDGEGSGKTEAEDDAADGEGDEGEGGEGAGEEETEELAPPADGGVPGAGSTEPVFDEPIDIDEGDTFEAQLADKIGDDMVDALAGESYTVWTKDFDKIEPLEVDDDYKDAWLTTLDDKVQHMVGPMQKELERMMAARSQVMKVPGFRSGKLHGAGLHKLTIGDDRVFRRRFETKTTETAVCLLIDNSGSMGGKKMSTAMAAAYALSQTLERVRVKHEVLGFTTCYPDWNKEDIAALEADVKRLGRHYTRTEAIYMPIYKGFDERLTPPVRKRFAAAEHQVDLRNNVDGESVETAALRLLRRTEPRKVLIVLSDGRPAFDTMDYRAPDRHLKEVVGKVEKLGVETVGIGIMDKSVTTFYPKHVVLDDLAALPAAVMGQLKKILLK